MSNRYAVIMAGGSGTRLWPMSRSSKPKQLLRLCQDGSSLLQASVRRLLGLFEYKNIYIIAAQHHLAAIADDLPELPKENLIGEPVGRDTANAVGLSAAILHAKDPDAVMGIFTADHLIEPISEFQTSVRTAFDAVDENPEYLATFGIKPTSPHTGLGYIHRGERVKSKAGSVFQVQGFREKPDLETAKKYLAGEDYYWNSGMFVWKVSTILNELQKNLPENTEKLLELGQKYGCDGWAKLAEEIYPALKKISIDFAVMEKAKHVLVAELSCRWADVGSWSELEKVTGLDADGNAVLAKLTSLLGSKNNVVVSSESDHLVAVLGADELVVIHTADATLVCPKSQVQKIKDLVANLDERFGKKFT
jgi:mannose-1-phosphate guanylyltransferase